jgi:hypothetical protein
MNPANAAEQRGRAQIPSGPAHGAITELYLSPPDRQEKPRVANRSRD